MRLLAPGAGIESPSSVGQRHTNRPIFHAPFNDAGNGAVSLFLAAGVGSLTYSRASANATTFNSSGLMVSVAANVPRSLYDPQTLIHQGYLFEHQAENRLLWSDDFSNAAWVKTGTTIGGSVTLPDGTTGTVNKIQEDSALSDHYIVQTVTRQAGENNGAASFWVKAAERAFCYFQIDDGAGNGARQPFDLTTGLPIGTWTTFGTGLGTPITPTVVTQIRAYPNGWFRAEVAQLGVVIAVPTPFRVLIAPSITGADNFNYTGTTGSGIYVSSAQAEWSNPNVARCSSYIKTTTVAVTRNADSLSIPTAGNWPANNFMLAAQHYKLWHASQSMHILSSTVDDNNYTGWVLDNRSRMWSRIGGAAITQANATSSILQFSSTQRRAVISSTNPGIVIILSTVGGTVDATLTDRQLGATMFIGPNGGISPSDSVGDSGSICIKDLKIYKNAYPTADGLGRMTG